MGVSKIKSIIHLLLIILITSLLTSCSSTEDFISIDKRPDYELKQREAETVTEKPLFKNILKAEDQEKHQSTAKSSSANPPSTNSTAVTQITQEEVDGRKTVRVTRVIDGDTIEYLDPNTGETAIGRLIGINSPEYTKEKQLFGKEATEFLTDLILGQEIQIESDPNAGMTDRYGRYLIHAFIGGRSIQSILIMEGLVRVAYLYDKYKYIDTFQEAEEIAKKSGINIWSIPGYVDNRNGFNMEVIKNGITKDIKQKLGENFSIINEFFKK